MVLKSPSNDRYYGCHVRGNSFDVLEEYMERCNIEMGGSLDGESSVVPFYLSTSTGLAAASVLVHGHTAASTG
jgi:hypothetical protein